MALNSSFPAEEARRFGGGPVAPEACPTLDSSTATPLRSILAQPSPVASQTARLGDPLGHRGGAGHLDHHRAGRAGPHRARLRHPPGRAQGAPPLHHARLQRARPDVGLQHRRVGGPVR